MDTVARLDCWFAERLKGLRSSPEAVAYIVGVLGRVKWDEADLSKTSIVVAYRDTILTGDFAGFQRLGDWVLFADTMYPEHLNGHREVIESLGRNSYYTCHRIMRGRWRVYEELADDLPKIARRARLLLNS